MNSLSSSSYRRQTVGFLKKLKLVTFSHESVHEMSVNNLNGLKTGLYQEFGLKDVKLSTYKTSIEWFKDGDYHKYSRKKTKTINKNLP